MTGISVDQSVRRIVPTWVRVVVTLVVLAATVWFLVIPQFSDAAGSFAAIQHISPWPVAAAALLESISLLSFSGLSRTILGKHRLPYFTSLRIDLATLAANFSLPGGGTTASAVRFGLLRAEKVPARVAISAATVEVVVENIALFLVFAVGAALSVAQLQGDGTNYVIAAGTVVVLLGGFAALLWLLLRKTDRVTTLAAAVGARIPFLGASRLSGLVSAFAMTLRELGNDRRRLAWAAGFALGNWILDACALWMMLAAFGSPMEVGPLLAVYGVGSVLALLPLTPGGVGLVEGVMVPALVGFGVPHSAALLGVLGWRVFEYWLPIPIGGAAFLSLRIGSLRSRRNLPRSDHDD
jgi:uncharacterized protein (TIRG00374 family)